MILLILPIILLSGIAVYLYLELSNLKLNSKDSKKLSNLSENEILEAKLKEAEIQIKQIKDANADIISRNKALLKQKEELVVDKEKRIAKRQSQVDHLINELKLKEKEIENRLAEIKTKKVDLKANLVKIAGKSEAEIRTELELKSEKDIADFYSKLKVSKISRFEDEVDELALDTIDYLLPLTSSDYHSEGFGTRFEFDNLEDIKRALGQNYELKSKLEELITAEIQIDEERFSLNVSCLDPIRREVGSRVIDKLISNNRTLTIPNLEDLVKNEKRLLLVEIKDTGSEVSKFLGFPDLPDEIKTLLGKCKFRFSYGQNLLKHTIEMANLGEALAYILGADPKTSKLACILHDIGKVVPEENGTQHHHISAEISKKYYNDDKLYNAIIAHHYDIDAESMEAEIVRLADSISGSRPGARRNSIEEYLEKIKALEEIAKTKNGVKQAFAIQAGREIRAYVDPNILDDDAATTVADKIAKEIEDTLSYPGIVKVNVIREVIATGKSGDETESKDN